MRGVRQRVTEAALEKLIDRLRLPKGVDYEERLDLIMGGCPVCPGHPEQLGGSATSIWYRCRQCGHQFEKTIEP